MMMALAECGHEFCAECWRTHFESILSSAASTAAFECMQTKCKAIASKDFVLQCLTHSQLPLPPGSAETSAEQTSATSAAYKYRVLLATDLVKESEDLQLCPGEKEEAEVVAAATRPGSTNYAGTPRTTTTNTTTTTTTGTASNIRIVSTISSTPTISFSYVRNAPHGVSSTSSPHSSFTYSNSPIISTPTTSSSNLPKSKLNSFSCKQWSILELCIRSNIDE